jgi:Ca2+-binding EF-hand superfamily protein
MNRLMPSLLLATLGFAVGTPQAQEIPAPPAAPAAPARPARPVRSEVGPGGLGGAGAPGGQLFRANPLLQALDTDKNGELSAAEIAQASVALKTLDRNGDGKVGADELRPALPDRERNVPRAESDADALNRLLAFDKNADGKLTAEELPERMRNVLVRADTDKDGAATKEELTRLLASQPTVRGERPPAGLPREERPAKPAAK